MQRKMMKIPRPTASARIGSIRSYLDRDHATDDQVADEDHEDADRDQNPANEVFEHRPEIGRRHEVHESREHNRQEGDQSSRGSSLRSERVALAPDVASLPARVSASLRDLFPACNPTGGRGL